MDGGICDLPGPSLPLSTLRLLVPPIRLVSAAIWQTVEQKIVSDYGLLEEFVFMVTEIVPQLLSSRQRAELILGLRARLILELCRSEETAVLHVIQPHLDRMQNLRSLWNVEVGDSIFSLFQDVFPGDFGPTYDKAIQTLMWLFLSRLEKLLPTQTLQQVRRQCPFKMQKWNTFLTFSGSICWLFFLSESYVVESGILSALCLPPVERVVIVNEQAETDTESGLVYTVCTEMEVESENKELYVEGSGQSDDCVQTQWFGLSGEVKPEMDGVVVTDPGEAVEASEGEAADDRQAGTLIIGEDGQVTVLDGVEKKPKKRGRKKKQPNRGLKMKRYLSQWRKTGKTQGTSNSKTLTRSHSLSKSSDLDDRTCKVCGKVVSQAKFLERHMSQHAEEQQYTCPSCLRSYKSLRYLQIHRCATFSEGRPGRKPKQPESGEEEGEQSSSGVQCETTGEEQLLDPDPNQDPDYLPSKEEGPFYCPHCSVEFKCKQTFRFHLRNICYTEQQVDPEKPDDVKHCFRCNECDKAFKYKSTLDSHKQTHNPLYCEVCMKLVRDSEALAMHKESHTPFQCNRCEENFPVFKSLHKHYIDVHNPTEPYTCTHCQTTFASLKRFIRHEWKHTGYQPFQCSHCSKRFRSYSDLLEHQKKHTKAYPFLCWECGKKFRHSLKIHRRYHTGERPFKCNVCEKGFVQSCFLTLHMRTHTGERPYVCTQCSKGFSSLHGLKRHRRLVHS
uniref:C2H2-type domain-containing protein n=1 Tax=Salarias fasciatus TaxID=181472 RepID=A0A672GFK9_SALFA